MTNSNAGHIEPIDNSSNLKQVDDRQYPTVTKHFVVETKVDFSSYEKRFSEPNLGQLPYPELTCPPSDDIIVEKLPINSRKQSHGLPLDFDPTQKTYISSLSSLFTEGWRVIKRNYLDYSLNTVLKQKTPNNYPLDRIDYNISCSSPITLPGLNTPNEPEDPSHQRKSKAGLAVGHRAPVVLISDYELVRLFRKQEAILPYSEIPLLHLLSMKKVLDFVDPRPREINPGNEVTGVQIHVQPLHLDFEFGLHEPFFCTFALYDMKNRVKISQTWDFELNPRSVLLLMEPHIGNPDAISTAKSAIFSTSYVSPYIYVLIVVSKALVGSESESLDPYLNSKMKQKEKGKKIHEMTHHVLRLGCYRQPFGYVAFQLFDENNQLKKNASNSLVQFTEDKVFISALLRPRTQKNAIGWIEKAIELSKNPKPKFVIPIDLQILIRSLKSDEVILGHIASSLHLINPKTLSLIQPATPQGKSSPGGTNRLNHDATISAGSSSQSISSSSNLIREMTDFYSLSLDRNSHFPSVSYINNIFLGLESLNFLRYPNIRCRNILIEIKLLADDHDLNAPGLKVIYGNTVQSKLTDTFYSHIFYHNKHPIFFDQLKVQIPTYLTEQHHFVLSFYHVSCSVKKSKYNKHLQSLVGRSIIPIFRGKHLLIDGTYSIPVAQSLPDSNYLDKFCLIANSFNHIRCSPRSSLYEQYNYNETKHVSQNNDITKTIRSWIHSFDSDSISSSDNNSFKSTSNMDKVNSSECTTMNSRKNDNSYRTNEDQPVLPSGNQIIKTVDGGKDIFTFSIRTLSSIYTQNRYIDDLFCEYEFFNRNEHKNEIILEALQGIRNADGLKVSLYFPTIFNVLFHIMCHKDAFIQVEAFISLLNMLDLVIKNSYQWQQSSNVLQTYVHYIYLNNPNAETLLYEVLVNVWCMQLVQTRTNSQLDKNSFIIRYSKFLYAIVFKSLVLHLDQSGTLNSNQSRSHRVSHQFISILKKLIVEIAIATKNLCRSDLDTQALTMSQKQTEQDLSYELNESNSSQTENETNRDFLPNQKKSLNNALPNPSSTTNPTKKKTLYPIYCENSNAKQLCGNTALFIRDLFSVLDRGFLFEMVYLFINQLQTSHTSSSSNQQRSSSEYVLALYKFYFLKIVCDYEHYVPLNCPLPFDQHAYNEIPPLQVKVTFYRQHFLAGLLLSELSQCMVLQNKANIRMLSIQTLYDLFWKHEHDPRYATYEKRSIISSIYFPYILLMVDLWPKMKEYPDMTYHESYFWIISFVWMIKYVKYNLIRSWWRRDDTPNRKKGFLYVLADCLGSFEFLGQRKFLPQHQQIPIQPEKKGSIINQLPLPSAPVAPIPRKRQRRKILSIPPNFSQENESVDTVHTTTNTQGHGTVSSTVAGTSQSLALNPNANNLTFSYFNTNYSNVDETSLAQMQKSKTRKFMQSKKLAEQSYFGTGIQGPKELKEAIENFYLKTNENVSDINQSTTSKGSIGMLPINKPLLTKQTSSDSHPFNPVSARTWSESEMIKNQTLSHEVSWNVLRMMLEWIKCHAYLLIKRDHVESDKFDSKKLFTLAFANLIQILNMNQSKQVLYTILEHMSWIISFFKICLFEYRSSVCGDLTSSLFLLSNSPWMSIQNLTSNILFLMLKSNYDQAQNISRMKLQSTIAVSGLFTAASSSEITTRSKLKAEVFEDCLRTIQFNTNYFFSKQKTTTGNILEKEVNELMVQLRQNFNHNAKMEKYSFDPEALSDLYYQISRGYVNSPDLRITELEKLALVHQGFGNNQESAIVRATQAILILQYLHILDRTNLIFIANSVNDIIPSIVPEFNLPNTKELKNLHADICQSQIFSETGFISLLQQAIQLLKKERLFEMCIDFYSMILPVYQRTRDYQMQATCYADLYQLAQAVLEENQVNSRLPNQYYRVAFYCCDLPASLNDLHGKQFIYRQHGAVRLDDIKTRLRTQFATMIEKKSINFISNTKPFDESNIKPGELHIQLMSVLPYFSQIDNSSSDNALSYDQNGSVKQFIFELPFTKPKDPSSSNETSNSSDNGGSKMSQQWKRKHILTVEGAFPCLRSRLPIAHVQVVDLSPIETAIELIERKKMALQAEINRIPKNIKTLQREIQGTLLMQVNAGPAALAQEFLDSTTTYSKEHQKKLGDEFISLIRLLAQGVAINDQLITVEQLTLQTELKNVYFKLKTFICNITNTEENCIEEAFYPVDEDNSLVSMLPDMNKATVTDESSK